VPSSASQSTILVDWVDESMPAMRRDLWARFMTSALIEIRLSNETEETTSPERQREQDEAYCGIKGWDIVHVCEDLDVSGGISPFDRPELGKWLTAPEYIDMWDVLVVSRPDRLSRSVFTYADLIRWWQAVLDRNSHDRGGVKINASPLLGVVRCFLCGSRLMFNHYGGKYAYYRCPNISERDAGYGNLCRSKAIPAVWLQDKTGDIFLAEAGHVPIKTRIATPDTGQAERIAAIGRQIAELITEHFVLGVQREDYDRHMATLTRQHAVLSAEPIPEPVVRWLATGRTVAGEWAARDTNGRRLLMIAAGFSIDVAKLRSGNVLAHMFDPDLERLAGLAAMGAREVPVVPNELTGARSVLTFDQRGNERLDGTVLVELGVVEGQD
jgi:hypothetical protein